MSEPSQSIVPDSSDTNDPASNDALSLSALTPGALQELSGGALMNLEARQTQLARGCVALVAAAAGYAIYRPPGPLALGIGAFGPRGLQAPQVELVLRVVSRVQTTTLPLWCPLTHEQFALLTDEDASPPRILVMLEVPANTADWLKQEAGRMVVRRGLYWTGLQGRKGRNSSELGVSMARDNALSVRSLRHLMERISANRYPARTPA